MICLNCNKGKALFVHPIGWTYCKKCNDKHKLEKAKETIEMTTGDIKEERIIYSKDTVQPFREGVLSKEYLRVNGTKGINATKDDIRNAREVWGHTYYKAE